MLIIARPFFMAAKSALMKNLYKPILIAIIALLICFAILDSAKSAPMSSSAQVFTWHTGTMTTTETYGNVLWGDGEIYPHQTAEFYWIIDQNDALTNPLTITLQVSPDKSNWFDHNTMPIILLNNAADVTAYTSTSIAGRYYRIVSTPDNTNTLTMTLKVVLR